METKQETWKPEYSRWRHGGWYVHNVRYPSGAVGCVSSNYEDKQWRIACSEYYDTTFSSRADAASAERLVAREQAKSAELLAALTAAVERMEAVAERIPVHMRADGVSQATHVAHMAGHLAQHAKIARAAIAEATGEPVLDETDDLGYYDLTHDGSEAPCPQ